MLWYPHTKRVRVMRSFNSVCISLEIVMICCTAILEKTQCWCHLLWSVCWNKCATQNLMLWSWQAILAAAVYDGSRGMIELLVRGSTTSVSLSTTVISKWYFLHLFWSPRAHDWGQLRPEIWRHIFWRSATCGHQQCVESCFTSRFCNNPLRVKSQCIFWNPAYFS